MSGMGKTKDVKDVAKTIARGIISHPAVKDLVKKGVGKTGAHKTAIGRVALKCARGAVKQTKKELGVINGASKKRNGRARRRGMRK